MDLPAISDESDLDLLEGDIVRNIQVNILSLIHICRLRSDPDQRYSPKYDHS